MRYARPEHVRRRIHAVVIFSFAATLLVAGSLFGFYAGQRARAADLAFARLFKVLGDEARQLAPGGDAEALREWVERRAALPGVALLAAYHILQTVPSTITSGAITQTRSKVSPHLRMGLSGCFVKFSPSVLVASPMCLAMPRSVPREPV